ncbi:C1q-related factor-like isoform X1 [Hippoglossus hippoglossus]|uniref:C1q-related factor-like isoform X1 n=1 Tax=Hippoglossus hippoglossus TaxID=8267 RepID=UPI00148E6E8C|nr:C1q-related factor-like isoform X1 [Hippoglossus hippoglossus]
MRAIVLLCLLGTAMAEEDGFTWGGPGENVNPTEDNVCLTDQASCGCCLMQQQIHRLGSFLNLTFNALEKELIKTKTVLNNVRGEARACVTQHNATGLFSCSFIISLFLYPTAHPDSRSAFSVALTNQVSLNCLGPFRDEKLIAYKHVFINLGDSYSVDTGIFTVPRSGVYSLALTVYSDAGSPGNSLAACASLQVNGQVVAGPREQNMQDQEDSATIVVALHLSAGDIVAVNLPIGCFLCDDNSHYNTFTGFLLYATD